MIISEVVAPVLILGICAWFVLALVRMVQDNRLRNKLIEKGMVDERAKELFQTQSMIGPMSSLKWGMVCIAIGAAFLIGMIPSLYHVRGEITTSAACILGGLALITYYFVSNRDGKGKGE